MATYDELLAASGNTNLINKLRVAVVVAAEKVRAEPVETVNHAARLVWAKSVFVNPLDASKSMMWAVLAQNRAYTLAQITGATDETVQTAVDAAVDVFAGN